MARIKWTRERGYDGAVLMLTARGEHQDRVRGLRTGADDCLVKPFDSDELVAPLRRVHKEQLTPVTQFEFGNGWLDFVRGEFCKDHQPLSLAAKEVELLSHLVNHRG